MKIYNAVFLFFLLLSNSFPQSIILTGSILEKEYTQDDRISGFLTYMNNSSEHIVVKTEREDENGSVEKKQFLRTPRSGKQLKVFKNVYGTSESDEVLYGNYNIYFYHGKSDNIKDTGSLILSYKNKLSEPATLRGIGILFNEFTDDSNGNYFEVKIEWKTIYNGVQTEIRKCYVDN